MESKIDPPYKKFNEKRVYIKFINVQEDNIYVAGKREKQKDGI